MTFGVFVPSFRPVFDPIGAVAAPPAANWWEAGGAPTPVAVYQPKGAASQAASYVNLVNPGTYDAAPGVAPSWSSGTGWAWNGSTQYLTTGIVPVVDRTWSAIVRFSDASAVDYAVPFGVQTNDGNGNVVFDVLPNPVSQAGGWENSGYLLMTGGVSAGVMAIAGDTGYLDGVAESGSISFQAGINVAEITIGCRNLGASQAMFFNGKIQALAIWDTSTGHATWMPAVSAAVALI